jgi:TP901 family phage tail tape measure protein
VTDNLNAKASLDFDLSQAIRSTNQLTTQLAIMGATAGGAVAKEFSRAERESVNLVRSLSALVGTTNLATVSTQGNLSVIKQQERNYSGYAQSIRVAAQAQRDLDDRTAAAGRAATKQQQFNSYVQQSNSRVAALEEKDRVTAIRAVDAERALSNRNMLASAYQENRIVDDRTAAAGMAATKQQQFNSYVQQSNARVAALEEKDRVAAVRAVDAARALSNRNMMANATQENQIFNAGVRARTAAQNVATRNMLAAAYQENRVFNDLAKAREQSSTDNLISQRYALYDVARTWTVISAAILGASAAAAAFAIDYQSNFAQVQRTTGVTGDAIGELKTALIDITTDIPTGFGDVTGIASLGGQLGIASSGIENFTTVVAQMTATTNLSSEAAGTALGRFQALLGVPSSEFENLGSSILKVGVNSVATETQIVSVATQLASMGKFAGMTADQVIGLSGALASVGAPAERSRGAITRLFTLMSQAVSTGGADLQKFADVSGVSANEFAQAWGTDQFASVFQSFLQGVGNSNDANAALRDLGITSSRDVPLLMSLANAGDVVSGSFADAASGYADASVLGEQYAIIAETIASKLEVLGNTLKAAIVAIGDGGLGPLSAVLALVQQLAEAFLTIARNPVGRFFLGVAASLGVLIGVMAAYRAVQALTLASMYAMKTAQDALGASAVRSNGELRGLMGTVVSMGVGMQRTTAFTTAYNGSLNVGVGRVAAFKNGLTAMKAEAVGAGLALKSALVTTGIGVAVVGLTYLIQSVSDSFKSLDERVADRFGDLSGLTDAIKQDTAAYSDAKEQAEATNSVFNESANAYRTMTAEVTTSSSAHNQWATDLETALGAETLLGDAVNTVTTATDEQTLAIGENAKTWLANAIAKDTGFQEFYQENQQALSDIGFDLGAYLQATLRSVGGGEAYLESFRQKVEDTYDATIAAVPAGEMYVSTLADAAAASANSNFLLDEMGEFVTTTDGAFSAAVSAQRWSDQVSNSLGITAATADEAADSMDAMGDSLSDLLSTESELSNSTAGMQSALNGLGQSLGENGNSFSAYSEAGRSNLSALQQTLSTMVTASGGDNTRLATMIAGLMQQLANYGVDTVGQLAFVQSYLAQLTGGRGTAGLMGVDLAAQAAGVGLGQGFAPGAQRAANAAGSAAKTVRTLTDYVKDLAGVFSAAFDIRFGLDQSVDKTADAYQGLIDYSNDAAEAVRDAAQNIAEADAKIRGLSAAGTTLEYQLRVAQEYGDVLRANEILAEMAENNAKLTDAQNDRVDSTKNMSDAQAESSKALDGGTSASREQRDQVLSLLSAYQDQITALANTGLSQAALAQKTAQLKQQFVDQLRQLGYNEAEIQRYARSFDDVAYAIAKVPKNLTINANVDPAIRAIDEYTAHIRTAQDAANGLSNFVISSQVDDAELQKLGRGAALQAKIITLQDQHNRNPTNTMISYQLATLAAALASGNYQHGGQVNYLASGGVPGMHPGSPRGTDTVPAWLTPNEYVVQRSASQYYGLPFMTALNNMQLPRYLASGGPAIRQSPPSSGIGLVELLPTQLQQIVDALSVRLEIDGREVATAVNRVNAGSMSRGTN